MHWVFSAVLGLPLVVGSYCQVVASGLLIIVVSLIVEHGLWSASSVVVVLGL